MKMRFKHGEGWVSRRQQKKQALDFKPSGRHWDWLARAQYDNFLYALTKTELQALEAELYQYWTWDDSCKEVEDKWGLVKEHLKNLEGHSMGNRFTGSAGPR